ncbi:MAG: response regulator [Candidatus Omnitrophica bacterium]|nr:response regulator [Candidatus Omnitrophota bacterium]MBU4303986.1 response regulator [Candidatus Omnitrophota bacterium]MBU4419345.1 response regulator [Candidatus Omnitrophota bacterium]MBU4467871.1 response regulator [Candidatus Omnitrophota bacterium]MCG2707090.1 response regulator [Candidatus Omnitrophota bacterium]
MKEKILIVEDEKDIVKMLEYNLKKDGFKVIVAQDGEDALDLALRQYPNLILLDLMLPGINGLEVCKSLKKEIKTASIPIIMLTAKSQESDKIVGLELGADDYITKPFSPRELIARIKAVLRRATEKDKLPEIFQSGDLNIDFAKISVKVKDKPIELTSKEFELLKTLLKAKGRVLSRDYLLDTIWGYDHALEIQTRTVDVHVRTLRKKLKSAAKMIVTAKNYGYRFEAED